MACPCYLFHLWLRCVAPLVQGLDPVAVVVISFLMLCSPFNLRMLLHLLLPSSVAIFIVRCFVNLHSCSCYRDMDPVIAFRQLLRLLLPSPVVSCIVRLRQCYPVPAISGLVPVSSGIRSCVPVLLRTCSIHPAAAFLLPFILLLSSCLVHAAACGTIN